MPLPIGHAITKAEPDELLATLPLSAIQPRENGQRVDKTAYSTLGHIDWYLAGHQPVPFGQAFRIPEAREALNTDWDKLQQLDNGRGAWGLERGLVLSVPRTL